MNSSASLLTQNEQHTAHTYWSLLLFPRCHCEFDSSLAKLKGEPAPVIDAVLQALIVVWSQEQDPQPHENPFPACSYSNASKP